MCEMCVGWSRCRVSKPGQAPPPPGGPAGAWRPRGLACRHSNFACNSPAACSNIEFASLELQRFLRLLKFGPIELHAKFVWGGLGVASRSPARPRRRLAAPPVPGGPAAWPVGTAISHAIPQQLVQILNLHRWNCSVFCVC